MDRAGHAQALLSALDQLPNVEMQELPGIYLDVSGRPQEIMVLAGLNASGLDLLNFQREDGVGHALVYATPTGLSKLRRKVEDFAEKDRKGKDGQVGRPFNADLVQSMGAIVEAGLRALWRSPSSKFPVAGESVPWEVWLEKELAHQFIEHSAEYGIQFGSDRLEFPEDIVAIATGTRQDLATAIRRLPGVRALASPSVTAEHFDAMAPEEQADWVDELLGRTTFQAGGQNFITLLDRGVSRAHPLIEPALAVDDRHAAVPAWALEDFVGHGTKLAGLALYGDLTTPLQAMLPIAIGHRLESAKIIPDVGDNPHHLLGTVTRDGVDAVETGGARLRTFVLASTTEDDTPHDGAPTSWSTEIDQLSSGVSGINKTQRLFLVSAGNSDQNLFGNEDYLTVSDSPENEIESPAQAWNAISVGAYTEKHIVPAGVPGLPIAATGDLSPSSRTASWASHWPIKPDVVMEGGNWLANGAPPPMRHPALSLLTTDHQYPARAFATVGDTSGATALAAKAITELWSDYPNLWPETVRALFVSSARWTQQMRGHLPANPSKGSFTPLFKRYGYGVPDMERARRSASNALTLIVQDQITPYKLSETGGVDHVHNGMRIFELPWPVEELRKLTIHPVTLRVALSTFVAPNPAEAARGLKYRYASHNLRFKLNKPGEKRAAFLARISKVADEPDEPLNDENEGWRFGRNRRDVGSLHIDELICAASDLAHRNLLAVHPVAGWWKTRVVDNPHERSARFSLVVEIDAGEVAADLYAEVQIAVNAINAAKALVV